MRCKYCGSKIKDGQLFCPKCSCEIKLESTKGKTNNKKMIVGISIILILVLVGIGGWHVYHFVQKSADATTEAKTTITSFFDAYCSKSGDANNYLTFTSMDNTPITYDGYQGYCAEKIKYKILDVSKSNNDNELLTVKVEIQNIDLNAVLNKLNEKTFNNDDEIMEYFYSLIQSVDAPTHTYQCDIKCKEYPTGMKILFDAELSNALLGGYSAYVAGNNE